MAEARDVPGSRPRGRLALRFAADRRRAWRWYSITSATPAMTTLLLAVARYDADTQTGSYHGLWQRISITVGFGYFGVLATHLLRRHGTRPGTSPEDRDT
jgi:hypothetical protein